MAKEVGRKLVFWWFGGPSAVSLLFTAIIEVGRVAILVSVPGSKVPPPTLGVIPEEQKTGSVVQREEVVDLPCRHSLYFWVDHSKDDISVGVETSPVVGHEEQSRPVELSVERELGEGGRGPDRVFDDAVGHHSIPSQPVGMTAGRLGPCSL